VKVDFDEGLFHISNGEWFAGTTIVYAAKGDDAFGMRCDYKLSTLAQIETEMEDDGMRRALVSGHDIERWLLKTAKAAAVSKNLSRGRATPFRRVLARLRNTRHAPRPGPLAGGGRTLLHDEYRRPDVESPALAIAAAHQRSRRHRSLGVKHLGSEIRVVARPLDVDKYPFLRGAKYRPVRIIISYSTSTSWLTMSCEDGRAHEALTVQHVRAVP